MDCSPLLCPWDSPGKNTGVGCHALLQGIFPTQRLDPSLLHCRQVLYHLSIYIDTLVNIVVNIFICVCVYFFFFSFIFTSWRLITLQYCSGFCHTLTWISHGSTCVPHPDSPLPLPSHPIPLGHPSAPGLSACLMHPTWDGDLFHTWWYICFKAILRSSHPCLLPQGENISHRCSIHLCLFFCPEYRVIITIFYKFHIYASVYCIGVYLSGLLHSVYWAPVSSTS